ncbi:MAG: serine/threonine-protein kinase [Gemmataceae bacterium]
MSQSAPISSIGKVSILETLGKGAHSTIFRVLREEDSRDYALKVVPIETDEDRKFLDQAKHEIKVSQLLNHRNCIKVHCLETEGLFRVKKAKLLIEYVHGKTLDQVKLLGVPKLLRVFTQVADGLAHMHKKGVYHADMKPNNVMLSRATVKILDYGLSWIKGESKDRVQGTPKYIAPETVTHKLVNERTDIFNFGVTMYRLVTLQFPPRITPNEDGLGMTEEIYNDQLVPVKDHNKGCPQPLAELIESCIQFKATARPEMMSEIQGRLDRLADKFGASEDPEDWND